MPVWMEREMPRSIARWKGDARRIVRRQNPGAFVELPNENSIQAQVRMQNEAPGAIRLDHVRMGVVMAAQGKASVWSVSCLL